MNGNHRSVGQGINALINAGIATLEGAGKIATAGVDRLSEFAVRGIQYRRKGRKK